MQTFVFNVCVPFRPRFFSVGGIRKVVYKPITCKRYFNNAVKYSIYDIDIASMAYESGHHRKSLPTKLYTCISKQLID